MSASSENKKEWARVVRAKLGLSQSQLAAVLGVSVRAVQSYEQGWRAMPRPVAAQLMTVLALHSDHPNQSPPCWSLTGCKEERRSHCAAFKVGGGRFCWMLSGSACGMTSRAADPQPCVDCVVMKKLLGGPCRHNVADTRPPTTDSRKEEKP